VDAWKTWTA
jgi:predicted amidohydrolase YtcJ